MRNRIGIIALLLISQSLYAEEMMNDQTTKHEMAAPAVDAEAVTNETPAEASTMPEEMPAQMTEQSGFSRGSVVRSAFTTEIAEREPTQDLKTLTNDNSQVMFFTELRDMNGQTAIHRWQHDGKVVAEIKFNVKGPRWRVWSSKNLMPQSTGDWKVSVVNGAGEVISEKELNYEMAAVPAAEEPMEKSAPADSAMPAQ